MAKTTSKKAASKKSSSVQDLDITVKMGRKRNPEIEAKVLEAAIDALAEVGFDSMTMDLVAGKAETAKTTVYRRWPSKAELVRDALIWMGSNSVNLQEVPDTGSLRNDLLALAKPHSSEFSERKIRVLSKLGSFYSDHPAIAKEVTAAIFGPWTKMNELLMKRAVKRGDLPAHADVALAGEVIIAMTLYRTATEHKQFTKDYYARLLDRVLLPALAAADESRSE